MVADCSYICMQGNDPRKELLAGSSELPDVYRSVVDMLQSSSARDACAFYEAFVSMLMSFAETTKKPSPLVLPTLQYVIEHGKEVVPPSDLAHDNKGGDGCEAAGVIIDWGADTSVGLAEHNTCFSFPCNSCTTVDNRLEPRRGRRSRVA